MKAFLKKEWMEMTRTGRLLLLVIIFAIFGIMNPAIAKLTPWMMEMLEDSIAQSGLQIGEVTVNAMTSWTQFYKNAPMTLIVIVLMSSGVLTNEYQRGTLVQVVTKGLSRKKIMLSKMIVTYGSWTALYLIYFGITYGYTAYFWGGDEVPHLMFGVFAYWLFGMVMLALLLAFSAVASTGGQVLMGTGGVAAVLFFANYVPKLQKYLPLQLMNGLQTAAGAMEVKDFYAAMIIAGVVIAGCGMISMAAFDRKRL